MATAIPTACLASSAIRCRDVETEPNLGVLAVFPSTGATCRNLDSGLSEISIVFQAAVPKLVASKYTTSGVRRPSEL